MDMTLKEQKEHFIKFYGRRLPVHDYDYFKQRFNEIINSVVEEELKFLYKEYAEEDDSKLHESAKPIKKNLLKLINLQWISIKDEFPKDTNVVFDGYSKKWIDLDFNPHGIRECFIGGDGEWFSARWSDSADSWITEIGESPTHWKYRQPPKK